MVGGEEDVNSPLCLEDIYDWRRNVAEERTWQQTIAVSERPAEQ